jgi:hypothetical protein
VTRFNAVPCCISVLPAKNFGALAFQVFVNSEKVLDLVQKMLLNVGVVCDPSETWIACCVRQNFLIRDALVEHLEESYGANLIDAAWEGWRIAQDQDV